MVDNSHARRLEGLKLLAPLREPLILSAALVAANLLLLRLHAISSFFQLAVALAVEGILCGMFLLRMLLSWRLAGTPMPAASAPAEIG
jgi:hypothetical protein